MRDRTRIFVRPPQEKLTHMTRPQRPPPQQLRHRQRPIFNQRIGALRRPTPATPRHPRQPLIPIQARTPRRLRARPRDEHQIHPTMQRPRHPPNNPLHDPDPARLRRRRRMGHLQHALPPQTRRETPRTRTTPTRRLHHQTQHPPIHLPPPRHPPRLLPLRIHLQHPHPQLHRPRQMRAEIHRHLPGTQETLLRLRLLPDRSGDRWEDADDVLGRPGVSEAGCEYAVLAAGAV